MYSSGFFARNCERVLQRHPVRDIAIQRIMRAGLIGENIGHDAAFHDFGQNIRAIADKTDRKRLL